MAEKLRETAKPNIDRLYEKLFSMKEMLGEVINTAQEAANDAGNFGGDISKVVPNQLRTQFVVMVQNLISQQGNPVCLDSMIQYLDSLPLSKVRVPRGEEAMMNQEPQMGTAPVAPMGSNAMTGVTPNVGSAIPPEMGAGMAESLESAILRAKGQPLLDEARQMWEEEHQEFDVPEGTLDFKAISENYQRKPPVPEVFTKNTEDKVYKRAVESAKKPKAKLQEADKLMGVYPIEERQKGVADMNGWRDLIEENVIDDTINERLGAAAVANALLSESGDTEAASKGIQRMKELVSPEPQGLDAGDMAKVLMEGNGGDFADEIQPARFAEASSNEDITSLVLNDSRDPVDVVAR